MVQDLSSGKRPLPLRMTVSALTEPHLGQARCFFSRVGIMAGARIMHPFMDDGKASSGPRC